MPHTRQANTRPLQATHKATADHCRPHTRPCRPLQATHKATTRPLHATHATAGHHKTTSGHTQGHHKANACHTQGHCRPRMLHMTTHVFDRSLHFSALPRAVPLQAAWGCLMEFGECYEAYRDAMQQIANTPPASEVRWTLGAQGPAHTRGVSMLRELVV